MFIFLDKGKNENKTNKEILFLFLEGPTRFDLAPTYFYHGWKIRVT